MRRRQSMQGGDTLCGLGERLFYTFPSSSLVAHRPIASSSSSLSSAQTSGYFWPTVLCPGMVYMVPICTCNRPWKEACGLGSDPYYIVFSVCSSSTSVFVLVASLVSDWKVLRWVRWFQTTTTAPLRVLGPSALFMIPQMPPWPGGSSELNAVP